MPFVRSVPEILRDIVTNVQRIIRSELRLAKTEIREESAKARKPVFILGLGATAGAFALFFALWALFYGLRTALPAWVASLLVAGIAALIAAALFLVGKNRLKQIKTVPEKTIESLKENVPWARHRAR